MLNNTTNATKIRCAIYIKGAVKEGCENGKNSREFQQNHCKEFIKTAEAQGWVVPKIYEDYGEPDAICDRLVFQELIADIKAGKIDEVFVLDFACFGRSESNFVDINNDVLWKYWVGKAFESLITIEGELQKYGVSIESVTEAFDTSTPSGKSILNILLLFAKFERELIHLQVKTAIEQPPKTRCAIYIRKAVEEGCEEGDNSLEFQQNCCKEFIESRGWIVSKVYKDDGESGATLERAGLQELLADIKAGKIDRVVVSQLDRLTQFVSDFLSLIADEFQKYGVSVESVTEAFDTSTPSGKTILNILLIFSEFERELIRLRDKAAAESC
jgi:DNA invertase Pin-like site-specific DNA recombinase